MFREAIVYEWHLELLLSYAHIVTTSLSRSYKDETSLVQADTDSPSQPRTTGQQNGLDETLTTIPTSGGHWAPRANYVLPRYSGKLSSRWPFRDAS